jgi:hypothetical protein
VSRSWERSFAKILARAAELGAHRAARPDIGEQELAARRREHNQDGDLYRIAARQYACAAG